MCIQTHIHIYVQTYCDGSDLRLLWTMCVAASTIVHYTLNVAVSVTTQLVL